MGFSTVFEVVTPCYFPTSISNFRFLMYEPSLGLSHLLLFGVKMITKIYTIFKIQRMGKETP
jgi:hypothetical protein